MGLSGRADCSASCPLAGIKRTPRFDRAAAANDPKRTLAVRSMAPTKVRECSAAFLLGSECEADKADAAPDQDQAEDIAHHESSTLMPQERSPSSTGTIPIQSPFYKAGAEEVPKRDSET